MKPNANFKLSKSAKRMIASCADRVMASQIKNMYIQAELAAAVQPRAPKRRETQGA
jgi:hypothetical protein